MAAPARPPPEMAMRSLGAGFVSAMLVALVLRKCWTNGRGCDLSRNFLVLAVEIYSAETSLRD